MPTILKKGPGVAPLDFTLGSVLVLKSTKFPFHKSKRKQIQLNLSNENADILLSITFDTGMSGKHHEVRCNDRTHTSLGDGWGKAQKIDMSYVDFQRWSESGVAISVHCHYSTDSKFGRYQILLGNVTICNFDKGFPGPATQISYTGNVSLGPDSWTFSACQVSDLHPRERQFLTLQKPPSPEIHSQMAISIPPSHFIPTQTFASTIWDDYYGAGPKTYYLGPGNVLHEYGSSRPENVQLSQCHIVLDPTSSIAVMPAHNDVVCIYYQDPETDFIRRACQWTSYQSPWFVQDLPIAKAVKGSSIAIIRRPSTANQVSCIFYQDPELHLRERYYDEMGSMDKWVLGSFNAGVQPRGTPITAEVVHGKDVDINVTWRDSRGRVASTSWSKSSGWDLPNTDHGETPLDGRD